MTLTLALIPCRACQIKLGYMKAPQVHAMLEHYFQPEVLDEKQKVQLNAIFRSPRWRAQVRRRKGQADSEVGLRVGVGVEGLRG